ncbi:hypothetical protein WH47_09092 [Habropoda laboriosa]|uniref:Uncharacterized protein n=1 Tax=Habropoda laboriosa TaxID=597456 RepID=A0A0L7QNE0_9HYME|nr:hypothetical protein WH47_09092 [Habropoda laboriosa]
MMCYWPVGCATGQGQSNIGLKNEEAKKEIMRKKELKGCTIFIVYDITEEEREIPSKLVVVAEEGGE